MNRVRGGGALDPEFLLEAYTAGFFPMADPHTGEISWYSPDPRTILPLAHFHVPRSLKALLRKKLFEVRFDTAFEEVIRRCAERTETWISDGIRTVFVDLHRKGFAHSVETWYSGELAGGLYGLSLRGAFFGEVHVLPQAERIEGCSCESCQPPSREEV